MNDYHSRLKYWLEKIENHPDYPVISSLEKLWQTIEQEGDLPFDRDEAKSVSNDALSALCYFVDMGFYPPPELLLCVLDCYQTYMISEGKLTLEESFFGKPKRNIGNHAARFARKGETIDLMLKMTSKKNEDKSQIEIVEEYIKKNSLKIDADSLLRSYRRRIKDFNAKKTDK